MGLDGRPPSAERPLIVVEGVRYRYPVAGQGRAVAALDGIDLTVRAGEFVAVVGKNGSGKSTLARHLNGLLVPQEGRVLVEGMDTRDPARVWEVRRRVGMVFQNPDNQLLAPTVEEDVAFGPENFGLAPADIRRRVDEALARVGMSAYRRYPPHRLSGGQKQRVAIAGVLAMQPPCMVLDEPTSMLDPSGRREVLATLQQLRRDSGMAVVYITHRMAEVVDADRVVVMDRGRIAFEGPPRAVFEQVELLRALDLDVPPTVCLARRLRAGGLAIRPGTLTVDELVDQLCPSGSAA